MWPYADSRTALRDALRLSRAMTFKSAAADLPLGGGKGVIALPAAGTLGPAQRRAALADFAETVEVLAGRYVTAEDVGTSAGDMRVIARGTRHVTGLARSRGGSGDPSPFTALGVLSAMKVSCRHVFGTGSLRGRSVAVIGLGRVGSRLAALCARAGARLSVTDLDPGKRALADRLGARWLSPGRALTADVDVLAPCALGGVLDHASVASLRCAVIAGAANNQLAEDSVAHELAARAILWAPDFVANAGGIINIAVELEPAGYDPARARERVRAIASTLEEVYARAAATGATSLAAALELARSRLGPAPARPKL